MNVYDMMPDNVYDNGNLDIGNDPSGNAFNVERKGPVKVNIKKWFSELEDYTIDTLLKAFMDTLIIRGVDTAPSHVLIAYVLGEFMGRIRSAQDTDDINNAFKVVFEMCDEVIKTDADLSDDAFDYIKVGLNKYLYELKRLCKEAAKS